MPVVAFDHYNLRADRPMLDLLRRRRCRSSTSQLFFRDPAGNGIELQFDAGEPAG